MNNVVAKLQSVCGGRNGIERKAIFWVWGRCKGRARFFTGLFET